MYKKFVKLSLFAFLAIFAIGCSDENAFSAVEDKIDDEISHQEWEMSYDQRQSSSSANEEAACFYGTSTHTDSWCCKNYGYQCYQSSSSTSEANACYYGTSTHSDYWCCSNYGYRCNSYSSSSYHYYYSSSSESYYTETAKNLKFTLTYYKQRVKFDESSLTDGDPEISFKLKFVNITGDTTTKYTGLLLDLSNQGSWSGAKSATFAVPANTEKIYVCPSVIDEDAFFDDDYSSGYCYIKSYIGYLSNYTTVEQSDYESSKYYLEWEWYLY